METRSFKVNEKTYQMLRPAVEPAMMLCNKVSILLGPVMANLFQDSKDGLALFASSIKAIDPGTLQVLIKEALKISMLECEGKTLSNKIEFEKHFDDDRGSIYPVCLRCLWECVKDFFPLPGTFGQKWLAKMAEKASLFQPGGKSTGGSEGPSGQGCADGPNSKTEL